MTGKLKRRIIRSSYSTCGMGIGIIILSAIADNQVAFIVGVTLCAIALLMFCGMVLLVDNKDN